MSDKNYIEIRPWGKFEVLSEGEGYKVKKITVNPGGKLSLQSHRSRSEHWVVVKGTAVVVNRENEIALSVNESIFIPAGTKHRLSNEDVKMLEVIEIQTGDYLGEDDITRYDDIYYRA